jgi:hypothetical protein
MRTTRWVGSLTDRPWQTVSAPLAPAKMRNLPATYKEDVPLKAVRRRVVAVDGGLRAICEVQGVPLTVWSREEAEGFLSRWAAVLNALKPAGVQFVARSRDGALRAAVAQRRADAEGDALVPYKELGLASARHLEGLMQHGDARALEFFLVVPGKREADVDADVATYAHVFGQLGMRLRRLEEPELSLRLASVTRPDVPSHWYYSLGDVAMYSENPNAGPRARRGSFVARKGRPLTAAGWGVPGAQGHPAPERALGDRRGSR